MRPIFPFRVVRAAVTAVGWATPSTGMGFSADSTSMAVVDTVPQAISTAFRSKVRRNATSCRAYLMMVSRERLP